MPMKLDAHMANMYSMSIALNTSTMKSDAGRPRGGASGGGADGCCAAAAPGAATNAAPVAALFIMNSRRSTVDPRRGGFFIGDTSWNHEGRASRDHSRRA